MQLILLLISVSFLIWLVSRLLKADGTAPTGAEDALEDISVSRVQHSEPSKDQDERFEIGSGEYWTWRIERAGWRVKGTTKWGPDRIEGTNDTSTAYVFVRDNGSAGRPFLYPPTVYFSCCPDNWKTTATGYRIAADLEIDPDTNEMQSAKATALAEAEGALEGWWAEQDNRKAWWASTIARLEADAALVAQDGRPWDVDPIKEQIASLRDLVNGPRDTSV